METPVLRGDETPGIPTNAQVPLVLYFALLSACFFYAPIAYVVAPLISIGESFSPEQRNILKLVLLGAGVLQLIAGFVVAHLNITPAGWDRTGGGGWERRPERLKKGHSTDTAQSFLQKAFFGRVFLGLVIMEAAGIAGFLVVVLRLGATVGFVLIAVALLSMGAVLPRILYIKETFRALREIEAAEAEK
jgi:hypothetical protein